MEWAKTNHISTYKIDAKLSFDENYIWHTSNRHVAQESIIKSPDETWDWCFHMRICTLSLFFTVRFPYYPLSSTVSSKNMFSIQTFIEIRNIRWWRRQKKKTKKEQYKKLLNFCHCLQLLPYWVEMVRFLSIHISATCLLRQYIVVASNDFSQFHTYCQYIGFNSSIPFSWFHSCTFDRDFIHLLAQSTVNLTEAVL